MPDSVPRGPVMTVREVAEYFRIHPSTIYRLLREGNLPAFKIGSDWRFNRSQVDQWMLRSTSKEAPQGTLKRKSR